MTEGTDYPITPLTSITHTHTGRHTGQESVEDIEAGYQKPMNRGPGSQTIVSDIWYVSKQLKPDGAPQIETNNHCKGRSKYGRHQVLK